HAVGCLEVGDAQGGADLGPAEVELEAVRNAERQSLHRDLPDERRQDAPLPHSRCLADQLDGHLGRDHLVEANLVQVEVRDPAPDRIHLEVLEDRGVRRLLALEHDVEDGVTSVRPGEYASQRPLRHRDRVRLLAAPVQDAGNETRAAQPRARPRSGAFALLHLQPDPLSCHGGRLYPQARGGRPRAVSQKSCVSPPKIAETESSANTFMIVSASRPEIGSTVMLSGRRRGSIGTVSVTTMPARSAAANRSSASLEKMPCVANTHTAFAPCSWSARAPASSVPPVMIASSPTIATLPATRPVISVTSAASCPGRVLCVIAKPAPIISPKRTACFARPASGATEITSSPSSPRSRKWRPKSGSAVMWSTGMLKKPWIWPAWRSIVRIRSAPASWSM